MLKAIQYFRRCRAGSTVLLIAHCITLLTIAYSLCHDERVFKDYSETKFCLRSVVFPFFSACGSPNFSPSKSEFKSSPPIRGRPQIPMSSWTASQNHHFGRELKTLSIVETNGNTLPACSQLTLSCSSIELRIT